VQVSRRWWFGAAMVAALGLGCAGSDATLVVIGNVRPDAVCSYSTLPAAPTYAVGVVDLAFERQYIAHVLIHNTGSDEVEVNGGWRNVWREPSHAAVISGKGDPARGGLIPSSRTIEGGGRAIVEVDVLGAAQIRFRRDFEADLQQGEAPRPIESSTIITFEGDAGGEQITSEPWTYGLTVTLGQLVDAPPGSDNPNLPGQDCCLAVASTSCEPGQNDQRGSCSECAGCWPEVCNFSQNPACGGAPVPGCGQQ
jgi:hypothetical protein